MSISRKRRYDPDRMAATETSMWDVYNNVADVRDNELIKDWNDSLNFLLIFAAIFAAVLIALIVESMQLLQQDPQDLTNSILLQISSQLAKNSTPAYQIVEFEAPRYAVVVNALLFSSLCCSLIAALAGVIALQWVNEYDARLDTVDPRKHALIRHFRFMGVKRWRMGDIIAVLPLLLHASVFLFFVGITEWMRNRHDTIFHICVGGMAVSLSFYIVTAVIPAMVGNAPFRSPMARGLRVILRLLFRGVLLVPLTVAGILSVFEAVYDLIRPLENALLRLWDTIPNNLYSSRVEADATRNTSLENQVVIWTANNVEVTRQSLHRLIYILDQARPLISGDKELTGPWYDILDQVAGWCWKEFPTRECSETDLRSICVLVNARRIWMLRWYLWETHLDSSWDQWHPFLKLVGPLHYGGSLPEADLNLVAKLISLNAFEAGDQSLRFLEEIEAILSDRSRKPDLQVMRYAISSLSIYLWTHNQSDLYEPVMKLVASLITIPSERFHTIILPQKEMHLIFSALYSAAFGRDESKRRFWGSRHRLVDPIQLSDKTKSIQAMHAALTSQFAAAAAQERSPRKLITRLRRLCRFLAYTPNVKTRKDEKVKAAEEILAQIPHFMDDPSELHTSQPEFAALPSIVWISKMSQIPSIHEYLEVLLSCRRKFPSVKPVWRDWCRQYVIEHSLNILGTEKAWLSTMRKDRRLVEILVSFDQLIAQGCTPQQHLVLVSLVVDDLREDNGSEYEGYFNEERKHQLTELSDPALRLVATRAAHLPYSGKINSVAVTWNGDAWIAAMEFWCERFEESTGSSDDLLLFGTLLYGESNLLSVITNALPRNWALENQLRKLLELKNHGSQTAGPDDLLFMQTAKRILLSSPEDAQPARLSETGSMS